MAFSWHLTWQRAPDQVIMEMIEDHVRAIQAQMLAYAHWRAPQIEAWMKANRVWTDRTTDARVGLYTDVFDLANQAVVILLSHGVYYGIFLELAHGGTYAILTPALSYFSPIIWNDVLYMMR